MADARLFFVAPSGEEGTQLQVQASAQPSVRQEQSAIRVDDLPRGTVLPSGEFVGQLLYWDGTAWYPVPIGTLPKTDGFTTVDPSSTSLTLGVGIAALEAENAQLRDSLGNVVVTVQNHQVSATAFDGTNFSSVSATAATVDLFVDLLGIEKSEYALRENAHYLRTPDGAGNPVDNLTVMTLAGELRVGFLGAVAVARPAVAGASAHQQIDSLMAGLVALGLVSDARTPPVELSFFGLNAAANAASKTLLPMGHAPGIYAVSRMAIMTSAATTGTFIENFSCDGPGGVNTAAAWTSFGATVVRQMGAAAIAYVASLGTADLSVAAVNTITGDYLIDVTYTIERIGPIPSP